jgi:hypothetical protein
MKKINWIIEKYIFSEYEDELCNIIKDSNNNCYLIDDTDINFSFDKQIKNKFSETDIVIFYGSLQLGQQIWKYTNFIPGIFLTLDNYECYKYYGYYGNYLLNSDYILMGLNDLKRNKDKIFNIFKSDQIFIRPSNGYKTFTGQLLNIDNWKNEINLLINTYGGIDIDQLILLSSKKNIKEENRIIVFNENNNNNIIDNNTYMINNKLVKSRITDKKIINFAQKFINNYTPDKAFTIDIAKLDNNQYKLLEIGSFNCASWYNSDIKKIVNKTNNLCLYEYNDYYNIQN